jgi:uncharacterized protein (DUF2141 family)
MTRSTAFAIAMLFGIGMAQPALAGGGSIRVHVSGFRNGDGDLACALFSQARGFPGGEPLKGALAAASRQGAECVFSDVAPGRYAVSVMHDENRNGKLDRVPLLGIPREGYGVSNNKTYATHGPVFEDSAFEFDGAGELRLEVTLRY